MCGVAHFPGIREGTILPFSWDLLDEICSGNRNDLGHLSWHGGHGIFIVAGDRHSGGETS